MQRSVWVFLGWICGLLYIYSECLNIPHVNFEPLTAQTNIFSQEIVIPPDPITLQRHSEQILDTLAKRKEIFSDNVTFLHRNIDNSTLTHLLRCRNHVKREIFDNIKKFYLPTHEGQVLSMQRFARTGMGLKSNDAPRIVRIKWKAQEEWGGWGDRVKSYGIALMLAHVLDRGFMIADEPQMPVSLYLEPAYLKWRASDFGLPPDIDNNDTYFSFMKINKIGKSGGLWLSEQPYIGKEYTVDQFKEEFQKYHILNIPNMFFPVCNILRTAPAFKEKLAQLFPVYATCEDIFGAVYSFLVRPRHYLAKKIELFKQEIRGNLNYPYISLHIRMGDNWGDTAKNTVSELPLFLHCASILKDMVLSNPGTVRWFIATDNEEVLRNVTKHLGAAITFHNAGKIVHHGKVNGGESAEGLQRTLLDWYVLGGADYMIISPSSGFGQSAGWQANKIGVSPYHYSNDKRSDFFLVCETKEQKVNSLKIGSTLVKTPAKINAIQWKLRDIGYVSHRFSKFLGLKEDEKKFTELMTKHQGLRNTLFEIYESEILARESLLEVKTVNNNALAEYLERLDIGLWNIFAKASNFTMTEFWRALENNLVIEGNVQENYLKTITKYQNDTLLKEHIVRLMNSSQIL